MSWTVHQSLAADCATGSVAHKCLQASALLYFLLCFRQMSESSLSTAGTGLLVLSIRTADSGHPLA